MNPNEETKNHPVEPCLEPDTLYRMAEAAATRERVPGRWREDAVAEYVAHGWHATANDNGRDNLRAYQCRTGRGAITNYHLHCRVTDPAPPSRRPV